MTYSVKEIFYTVQGEAGNMGRPAVFCRFSRCNLWSGLEKDRSSAICQFCDTDFVGTDGPGGGVFSTDADFVAAIKSYWTPKDGTGSRPLVVCTGGEPTLQLNDGLVEALHEAGFEVAVETNGTRPVPAGVDWICVSPKAGAPLKQRTGNELKLVFPKEGAEPERFENLEFDRFYLQPMDGPHLLRNIQLALQYCLDHPRWRLSLQTQKIFGDQCNEQKLLSLMAYAPAEDVEFVSRQQHGRRVTS